jgi:type VI secretion system protein ImpK
MREELANIVFPVFSYGLKLKDRLDRGEDPNLAEEQTALKKRLMNASEARRWPDYGGPPLDESEMGRAGALRNTFLGCRYALACWLDDLFIFESPWGETWKENSMEFALYQQRDRAYIFWEQVRLAESRMESDALEVFYLCVMLGFRGEVRDKVDKTKAWRESAEGQISRQQPRNWPGPQEQQPTTNVPPLRGRERLRMVLMIVAVLLGSLVPVAAYYVVKEIGK